MQVEHVLVLKNPDVPECGWVEGRDKWWQDEVSQQSKDCPVQWVDAEHPLFLLYTSGAHRFPSAPGMQPRASAWLLHGCRPTAMQRNGVT